eukprot:COSAG01_NODE_2988_length_6750_cov_2.101338_1_plen_160_part_00
MADISDAARIGDGLKTIVYRTHGYGRPSKGGHSERGCVPDAGGRHAPSGSEARSTCCAPVGGNTLFTKINIAFSGDNLMRLRITYTNWPTVRSAGTRYLKSVRPRVRPRSANTQTQTHATRALFLIDIHDITLVGLLHDDGNAVGVLLADPPCLLLPLL